MSRDGFRILKKARYTHVQERTEMRFEAIYNAKASVSCSSSSLVSSDDIPALGIEDQHRTTAYLASFAGFRLWLSSFFSGPSHVGLIVLPAASLQLFGRIMLLSLEGHVVEHVEEDLLWSSLYKGGCYLQRSPCLREFHALRDVNVRS